MQRPAKKEETNMGIMNKVMNGLSGNLNEISPDALQKEYGMYLMEGEVINTGFKLVRDVVLFTNKRIIDFDKQGATGQKMRVNYINLSSVIHVSAETAGFGVDDSEIDIEYIASPYFKANGGVTVVKKSFEFPKSYNIQPLYRYLQEIAYHNHEAINS